VFGLYKGLLPPLAGFAAMNAITFGVQGMTYRRLKPGRNSYFVSGMVAGVAQSIVVSPMELVKTQMQLQGQGMKYKHLIRHTPDEMLRFNGSWDCIKKIYKSGGLKGTYRGFIATAAREGPAMGVYFASYHELCRLMTKSQESVHELGVFYLLIAGGVTGSLSWLATFPVDVVKSRFQADINGKYSGLVDCLRQTYNSQGGRVFFRGLSTAMVRAFPVNAATLATVTIILRYSRDL
jgi:solute carrier family 25 carnitine/acylcarnitine transporter 20/29